MLPQTRGGRSGSDRSGILMSEGRGGLGFPTGVDRGRGGDRGFRAGGERGGAFRRAERGFGDRGRGGDRGFRGGFRGRTRGFSRSRYEAIDAPVFQPDPTEAVGLPGPTIAPGVVAIGVRRPAAGTLGTKLTVTTNHFKVTIPEATIHHYHVAIRGDTEMSIVWNQKLIRNLQEHVAPTLFTPRAVYDGRKSLFASRRLPLRGGSRDAQVFNVAMEPAREGRRPPKVYKVELKHVAEINPTSLKHYQQGEQSIDNTALTTITVMNIAVRMDPLSRYTFNTRSFFTDKEVRPIDSRFELWRGYFQSVRPGLHSMLVNIDISTGIMYAPVPVIDFCEKVLRSSEPYALVPGQGLNERNRLRLQRLLTGVRFVTSYKDKNGQVSNKPKVIRRISRQSADNYMFEGSDGQQLSVAQYFNSLGADLQYPDIACIETSRGAAFPIELCSILPGQLIQMEPPFDVNEALLGFSTKSPHRYLDSVVAGYQVFRYGQSDYLRQFGMTVSQQPEKCAARVLPTPVLNYGMQSKFKQIRPANGSWNLENQRLYQPADVGGAWGLIVYDGRRVRQREAEEIVSRLKAQADLLGIQGMNANPPIFFHPAQAKAVDVGKHLLSAGQQVFQRTKKAPSLFVVVLPNGPSDLYQAVKHFGDVLRGVATQCLTNPLLKRDSPQYWASVCLKINAKLGGINSILDPNAQRFIADPANPTMIIGAAVAHPAPGMNYPSSASMVGSIDSNAIQYTAITTLQFPGVETIADVEDIVYEIIGRHAWWKQNKEKKKTTFPKRIVYFRHGIPERLFSHILNIELPAIKAACKRHKINPAITVIVVVKRHHVRFFPTHGMANKSGNCPAGTVVDDLVGHPTEFEFYLQSHGGRYGTSRPTHYSVLHDENNFTADSIQSLTFALCHVNARSTCAISIPAPVHYACIVCRRASHHFDPSVGYNSIDETKTTASGGSGESRYQHYRDLWRPTHDNMRYNMYFQ